MTLLEEERWGEKNSRVKGAQAWACRDGDLLRGKKRVPIPDDH